MPGNFPLDTKEGDMLHFYYNLNTNKSKYYQFQ